MAEYGNGNNGGVGSLFPYADLNRRFDALDSEFRNDFKALSTRLDTSITGIRTDFGTGLDRLRTESRDQINSVLERVDRTQKSTNPFQLILVMLAICAAAGGAGAYVAKNLSDTITSVNETLNKTITAVDETLAKENAINKKGLETEERERIDSTRRIYDNIGKTGDRAWSRDAQIEFEKRIDEEKGLEREYVRERMSRNEHDIDRMASIVVPREDETQYRTTVTRDMDRLDRTTADTLARITEHLNKSDDHNEAKFAEVERVVHGYGLGDEVKDLQTQVRDAVDKIFRLISPSLIAPPTGPPGN